jgi:sporulation protein YlmC with PRC-barrel domain
MEIEYDMPVFDKNGRKLGEIEKIINDMWTGKPRKYMIRVEEETDAIFFKPEQVSTVTDGKVILNYAVEHLEQTE